MAKLNRDFEYKGIKFHLNDAKYTNEFSTKYLLLMWHEEYEYWQEQLHVDSKKEAMEYIKDCEKNHIRMFAKVGGC